MCSQVPSLSEYGEDVDHEAMEVLKKWEGVAAQDIPLADTQLLQSSEDMLPQKPNPGHRH